MQEHEQNNEITVQIKHVDKITGLHLDATLCGTEAAFKKAAADPEITALEGKALFEALIRQDNIRPDRHSLSLYHKNGAKHSEEHYLAGRRHDGIEGEAAYCRWDQNGTMREETHYQNGEWHDGANGEPERRKWDENGMLTYCKRTGQDAITDPAQLNNQAQAQQEKILKPFGGNLKLTPL